MLHLSEDELNILAEREKNRSELPLTNWESISAQLREEGVIREARVPLQSGSERWVRAAAAVLLVAGGAVAGRYGIPQKTQVRAQQAPAQSTPVTEVANNEPTTSFRSEDEAWEVLNRAGADYQRASAFLAAKDQNAPADSTSVYQARLVALDAMTSASRKALYRTPHDPVINQYYLAAQGAREATLRQLSETLPSGTKLDRW